MGKTTKKQFFPGILAALAVVACMSFALISNETKTAATETTAVRVITASETAGLLYDKLSLGTLGLSRNAFDYALKGFNVLINQGKINKDNVLSIIDFSLASGKKRLFVIDLSSGELLFNTYVSHGRGSGAAMATDFSNKPNSYKSSLGFYITRNTYNGKHGCSLRLEGEESGINDNALSRGIVMHSAAYADESIVEKQGFIGRSQGCPAIPPNIHKQIIETIKGGSCLFIYSPSSSYLASSKLVKDSNIRA